VQYTGRENTERDFILERKKHSGYLDEGLGKRRKSDQARKKVK